MNRTIEQWQKVAETRFHGRVLDQAIEDMQKLARQLATERASLFAENQRKQQLEQQVEELVGVLEGVTLTQDDIEMGRSASDEQHAAARAFIQKVRGGEC